MNFFIYILSVAFLNAVFAIDNTTVNSYINTTDQYSLTGLSRIIREEGYNKIEWKVNVAPNKSKLVGKYPNGFIESKNLSRIYTENGPNNSLSTLFINDFQRDFGVYEMSAMDSKNNKKIDVPILVEGKPRFKNGNNNINLYFEVGKAHNIECYVNGYPLPEVNWAFKECQNILNCENTSKFKDLSKNIHRVEIFGETNVVSILNFTATKTGLLMCNASNNFGSSSYVSTILLTDLVNNFNGMAVNGPPIIFVGDNVTIQCGVDKFNYFGEIIWAHRPLNQTNTFIMDPLNQTYNIVSNISTNYSHYSYLTIYNISHLFNGEYICKITEKSQSKTVKLSYPLMVRKPYKPRIYEYSNSTYVNLTDSVTLQCKFRGLPEPIITWYHNNQKLEINNDTRISVEDKNQTLHIRNTSKKDLGSYKCIALNIMGHSQKEIDLMLSPAGNEIWNRPSWSSLLSMPFRY